MTNAKMRRFKMFDYACPNCNVEMEFEIGTEEPLNIAGVIGPDQCLECGLPTDESLVIQDYLESGEPVI